MRASLLPKCPIFPIGCISVKQLTVCLSISILQIPDMVLGKVVEGNKLYGSGTMVVADDGFDLRSTLHEAVGKLSGGDQP